MTTLLLRFALLLFCLFALIDIKAQDFVQQIRRATPPNRVIACMNYFDTCRAVTQNQPYAFRLLDELTAVGEQIQDDQLARYCWFLKNTHAKHQHPNPADNVALFLKTGAEAEQSNDPQIWAVCEHFAGMYYYLNEDYVHAFEHLLNANQRFKQIGYANIPGISRYLYDLALSYYNLDDYKKAIALLTETTRYPAFNPNLHIQTYNTLAMAQARQRPNSLTAAQLARQNYQKAHQLAVSYGNHIWMRITYSNFGRLYIDQKQWQHALAIYRVNYQSVMRASQTGGYPIITAVAMAEAFYELGQLDSCRYYLGEALRTHRINTQAADYGQDFQDELFWQRYYAVARTYYRATHNLPESVRCADSLLAYQNHINQRYQSKAAALAEQRLLVMQHQAEMAQVESSSQIQRLLLGVGVGVALIIAILLGLLYRASQRRRQQETLANAEREKRLELEKKHISVELNHAKADLALFIENLQQAEFKRELTEVSLLTNDDWDEFRRRFERAHPFFFDQLRTQFATLTPAEERLMTLSKLNIDTRRMGLMLGISPSSVRTTKYRLRKRLGIDAQSPLLALLE